MDGGSSQPPQEPDPEASAAARNAADLRALSAVPFVADAVARLSAAITDLLEVRWPALSAEQMAASVRVVYREQARLGAAALRSVKAVDDRDDVVLNARPGTAGAAFLRHAIGVDTTQAQREADSARLLELDTGDLAAVGSAYAAGDITRGHVDVVVGVHRRLGAAVRGALVPVIDPETGRQGDRRCIEVVEATLARQARTLTVPELRRAANRLVEHLDPPNPDGAHERRYLHLSLLPDGSLIGRFACDPAQALALTTAIAAGATPQPGKAVDADGVEHVLRDERTTAQRRMDALVDAVTAGTGRRCVDHDTSEAGQDAAEDQPDGLDQPREHDPQGEQAPNGWTRDAEDVADEPAGVQDCPSAPEPEGEYQVRRAPGTRTGPYPDVEIVVTATLDQVRAALTLADPRDPRSGRSPGSPPRTPETPDAASDAASDAAAAIRNAQGFAHAPHGGPVHPSTLALLACSGRLRRVVLDPHGAVLDLGRTQRFASPAQRRALLARDVGCVIAGCGVPGEHCDVHHPTAWADGGTTDMGNLVLVCPRHHGEVHRGVWTIVMRDGVPWVRTPAWVHPAQPLLRNLAHRPPTEDAA